MINPVKSFLTHGPLVRFFRSSTLTESLAQATVNLKQKSRIPHCNLTRIDCKIET